jgi:hypothetical protein
VPLNPGTKLGPYEIIAPLGAGGMGEVYRVSADGNRFLVTAPLDEDLTSPVTLITDWTRLVEGH